MKPMGHRRARGFWLWPWLAALMLWGGLTAGHAATSAVVTFTNFPNTVSNTYNGLITLQINGLTNGVTNVLVQKFLDVNTNGVIDGNDLLVQQFPLIEGQARQFTNGATTVTVTNFMPGDAGSVPGQITDPMNFQDGDFAQNFVGRYIYRVSSPSGQFTAVTNYLVVTNTFFTTLITGTVENATSLSNVPNALVLLFSPQTTTLNMVAGAVANNSGGFNLRVPAGTYFMTAAKSNYVYNLTSSEVSVVTNTTNFLSSPLALTPASTNITGRVDNSTNSTIGVPGLSGLALSTNGYLSFYFTDTNGNFKAPILFSNEWVAPVNNFGATFDGYLTLETNQAFIETNKVKVLTNALTKATAIFYGVITNNSGASMPGVYINAGDTAGHASQAMTDAHGNYVLNALGGTNLWVVTIPPPASNPGLTNGSGSYVFSPANALTNINSGQAIQLNFAMASAFNTISGSVEDIDGNPISGVSVEVTGTLGTNVNGGTYQAFTAQTDSSGGYSVNVASGNWTVSLSTNSLISLGYNQFPPSQSTNLLDANAVINFTVVVCGEIDVLTTNLPDALLGSSYETNLLATSCQPIANWTTAYGVTLSPLSSKTNLTYAPGTVIFTDKDYAGYLESYFSYGIKNNATFTANCTATIQPYATEALFYDIEATVYTSAPIGSNKNVTINGTTWTAIAAPSQVSTAEYQTTLFRAGPDTFTVKSTPDVYIATNNMLMITGTAGSNTVASLMGFFHSLTSGETLNVASTVPFTGTNNTVVWIKKGTGTTNLAQYLASPYGALTTNPPPGLTLYPSGLLAGTPTSLGTNNGVFNFNVAAVDTASNVAIQELTLTVDFNTNNTPVLQSSGFTLSTNVFQMQMSGAVVGENYKLLMSTNLASTNWIPIFATNAATTNIILIPDVHATNPARFYKVEVAP
jgi:hypothetical protein